MPPKVLPLQEAPWLGKRSRRPEVRSRESKTRLTTPSVTSQLGHLAGSATAPRKEARECRQDVGMSKMRKKKEGRVGDEGQGKEWS